MTEARGEALEFPKAAAPIRDEGEHRADLPVSADLPGEEDPGGLPLDMKCAAELVGLEDDDDRQAPDRDWTSVEGGLKAPHPAEEVEEDDLDCVPLDPVPAGRLRLCQTGLDPSPELALG